MDRSEIIIIRAIALLAAVHLLAGSDATAETLTEQVQSFENYLKADLPAEH